jgi:hypothetical protein
MRTVRVDLRVDGDSPFLFFLNMTWFGTGGGALTRGGDALGAPVMVGVGLRWSLVQVR